MPGFDRTGPTGAGPMTGGARGFCYPESAGYDPRFLRAGYRGLGLRRGFRGGCGSPTNRDFRFAPAGRGMGRGYGRGYGWFRPAIGPGFSVDAADEVDMLKAQADYIKNSLDAINQLIDSLEKKPEEAS